MLYLFYSIQSYENSHVMASINDLSSLMSCVPLYEYAQFVYVFYWWTSGLSHVLATLNNTAMNIHEQVFFLDTVFIFKGANIR